MAERIAVLTTGRQDWGLLRSLVLGLRDDPRFRLDLIVGGMHLDPRFGETVAEIRAHVPEGVRELPFLETSPDPGAEAGRALAGMARLLDAASPGDPPEGPTAFAPDALVLLGDRSETLACATAAAIRGVPLVHLHGGEETEGAIDNALRHAITKLSHLHLTSHPAYRDRVIQMGEDPEAVFVVGAPGNDNLLRDDLPARDELLDALDLDPGADGPLLLVTLHPTTLAAGHVLDESRAVAAALEGMDGRHAGAARPGPAPSGDTGDPPATVVVTLPNADAGGDEIRRFWAGWCASRPRAGAVPSLGERRYWGMLKAADAVVGNSSSGMVEAPAVGLPAVNVGDRQKGRLRHPLTLDVPAEAAAVRAALERALSPSYRDGLRQAPPLHPPGPVAPRILEILADWNPARPPRKVFHPLR